ncbi:hypothetical protein IQ241_07180 [Romeria aff. gracilis LEGE 07310]|uniref:Uncharacterized protein n=1 Tax=Vasconcelosia minhoensis LEGE 07310 TaxID=915328 RepID=A0A8J7A6T3_9CYAN|nr:hypothetical protein [Romeria gracilis]MBE9077080.1 hypothetical protein [Romeria aff. gracilis LEGE 07310]
MELQAIREKLQSLKAEPPESEALPWSPSQLEQFGAAQSASPPFMVAENAAAISALKQRSSQAAIPSAALRATPTVPAERIIAQATAQLQGQIDQVNRLSQQQAAALSALRTLATRAETDLLDRGLWTHPATAAIAQFCRECESAAIPQVNCDLTGQLELSYRTVDFYQAEYDAADNAQALRERSMGFSHRPFAQPLSPAMSRRSSSRRWPSAFSQARQLWEKCLRSRLRPKRPARKSQTGRRPKPAAFTWLDGAIWFSGAAIVRLGVDLVLQAYPVLWLPAVMVVLTLIAIALYRTLLTPYPSAGLSYRLLIAIAGVLVGGLI